LNLLGKTDEENAMTKKKVVMILLCIMLLVLMIPTGVGVASAVPLSGPPVTITLSPTSLPDGTVGTTYSQTLAASGGTAPYTFTETGNLPAGLTLSSDGALTGTPTTAGASSFTVTATDAESNTGSQAYTLTINPSSIGGGGGPAAPQTYTVTYGGNGSNSGAVPEDGNSYQAGSQVTVLGNTGDLLKTGSTFAGWDTAPDGSGTSYQPGATFDISADTTLYAVWQQVASQTYAVTYDGNGATSGAAPTDSNSPYNPGATVTVLGNTGSLIKTGYIFAGWDTAPDGSSTSYQPSDTFVAGSSDVILYAQWILVTITISPTTLPDGQAGTTYSQTLAASGGTAPYTFTETGNLPAGLTLSSDGALTGTPTTAGASSFTVTATDAESNTGSQAYTLTMDPAPAPPAPPAPPKATIAISPTTLPDGQVGTTYNQSITASGGTAPYTFTETGSLPGGLTLGSDGALTGTPTTAGASSFTVTATDAESNTGSQAYTLTMDSAPAPPAPPAPPVTGLTVTPSTMSLNVGQRGNAVATAVYSDTSTADVTAQATWSSSNSQVAIVDAGRITAVAPGKSTITASYNGEIGTVALTVAAPAVPPAGGGGGGASPPTPQQPVQQSPPASGQPAAPAPQQPVQQSPPTPQQSITPKQPLVSQPVRTQPGKAPEVQVVAPAPVVVEQVSPVMSAPATPTPARRNPVLPLVGGLALVAAIVVFVKKRSYVALLALLPNRVVSVAISLQPIGVAMASLAFDDTKRKPSKVTVDVVNNIGKVIAKGVVVARGQSTDIALPIMALVEKMRFTAKTRGYRNKSKKRSVEFTAVSNR
jgi:uncharacterized repeat protein (TIGR02543 family)